MGAPTPFTLHVTEADLIDLQERLARTRFPDQAPGEAWATGADVDYLRSLVAYWRDGFEWRAQEAALNAFPQSRARLDGIDVHFIHAPGNGPAPMPLLLMHGWPGSVFEFLDIIPRLTDPARFGGDPADAFTVVAPSLPGYGLSFRPGQARFGVPEMADCLAGLMTGVLGYRRFGAQGGDWGAGIASRLGAVHPDKLIGIHLNYLMAASRGVARSDDNSEAEKRYLEELEHWTREEAGYTSIQGTKPQTLSFALTDSPAGLAAWIVEKFRTWSDCGGEVERAIDRDRMLADISLYWFTGAIGSSFWPYYARAHGSQLLPPGVTIDVPTGYAEFPCEILKPPRTAAARVFTDIRRWTKMKRGGHFAAMEQPEALAEEIKSLFRELR
jgi:microsomal epoxide hydrolase